ncbi:MAG: hypothetical protein JNM43_12550 [Planctomycetaceae bacterium]|nr:hypothetical protein [Planctomycetaceae bacterium]
MNPYPFWFSTIEDILVLSPNPTSEDTIRSDDAFVTFATMHRGVILDLSDIELVSSRVIGAHMHLRNLLYPLRKPLKLIINVPEILEVVKITRFTEFQLVFSTVEEAVNSKW